MRIFLSFGDKNLLHQALSLSRNLLGSTASGYRREPRSTFDFQVGHQRRGLFRPGYRPQLLNRFAKEGVVVQNRMIEASINAALVEAFSGDRNGIAERTPIIELIAQNRNVGAIEARRHQAARDERLIVGQSQPVMHGALPPQRQQVIQRAPGNPDERK